MEPAIFQQWIKSLKLHWAVGLGLLGLMAFSIFLRSPFFSVPMISDEGGYAYVAQSWSGDIELYRDIPYDRPQAIFLIYKLFLFIFGGSVEAIRLAAALYNALTVAALFFFARQVFSQRAAWLGALVYAIFSASPRIEGFTANAELFTLLPLVVAASPAPSPFFPADVVLERRRRKGSPGSGIPHPGPRTERAESL